MIEAGQFVIVGDWEEVPSSEGLIIMPPPPPDVYGAGWHPSTQAILRALASYLSPGMKVLDLGTGTGILAVAAARLGCEVYASEVHPPSFDFARHLFEVNGVKIHLSRDVPDITFDVVMANIGEANAQDIRHRVKAPVVLTVSDDNELVVLNA